MRDAWVIAPVENSAEPDVAALIEAHLAFARSITPPGHVHALDGSGLDSSDVTLFALRDGGEVLAIGALRDLESGHSEIKSMHTASSARGRGLGRAMLRHLLTEAQRRGCRRVSLETGTMPGFEPARSLYRSAGFVECEPFGDYQPVPNSVCMTLELPGRLDGPR